MKNIFLIMMFVLYASSVSFSQEDIQIGSNLNNYRQSQGGLFDYSDPSGINIKVQLWGYVKYPGYYVIPAYSTLNDLISFAGGPLEDALLNDLRIYRSSGAIGKKLLRYDINDLLWSDSLTSEIIFPKLDAGDVILLPGEPRYFLREDIAFYLSVTTAIGSLAALIISITK